MKIQSLKNTTLILENRIITIKKYFHEMGYSVDEQKKDNVESEIVELKNYL